MCNHLTTEEMASLESNISKSGENFHLRCCWRRGKRRRLGDSVTTGSLLRTWPFHASSLSCFNCQAIDVLQSLGNTYILCQVQILKCKNQVGFLLVYVMSYPFLLHPPVPIALMSLSSGAISWVATWLTVEGWEMPFWIKTSKLTEKSKG